MKKFVVIGSGTAGVVVASMLKAYWQDLIDVTIIHDGKDDGVSVGESTTPYIHALLTLIGIKSGKELIGDLDVTLKLGIDFKNWIPGESYFHGLGEVPVRGGYSDSSGTYSILNDCFNGGFLHHQATNTVPSNIFDRYSHGLHIDSKQFRDFLLERLEGKINLVDDLVVDVKVDGENIKSIECRDSGTVEADYFIDTSGFKRVLFKHLNPKWNDISNNLPIDRAIPQQVPYEFDELPSYTLSEATENGWIWRIPLRNRYGTGYLYSSKFTSDEEAREKYNQWLKDNLNAELKTNRVIRYESGYYDDYWIGNCLAVGLSSGFIEPLESTGIHLIIKQMYDFMYFNSSLKNLRFNRKTANTINRDLYVDILNFIALHYCTNRTDSPFWKHVTDNKLEWVKDVEEKCREEFLDVAIFRNNPTRSIWSLDSFVLLAHHLHLFTKEGLIDHLNNKFNGNGSLDTGEDILADCKETYEYIQSVKNAQHLVSHKKLIDSMYNNYDKKHDSILLKRGKYSPYAGGTVQIRQRY